MPLPPFKRFDICQPTLDLHEDDDDCDIVYFMTKVNHQDKDAWVVAVDMKTKTLQGVAQFDAGRYITFAYLHSRISKHLMKSDAPGTQENLKQPRVLLR
uniref:DUF1618 domain-containing protein n=1 Tax=Arundo donax TaxID=35708 RepID=A0A0A9FPR2_ARUDO